jgi:hypothetical protein
MLAGLWEPATMSTRTALWAALAVLLTFLGLATPTQAAPHDADRGRLGIPRTYDDALKHFDAAKEMTALKRFVTPSGNIYCNVGLSRTIKGCEIGVGAIKDPAVCSGVPVSKYVGRIEWVNGRAVPVCNTDTMREPGAKTLRYGYATTAGKFACVSETIGVTCINLKKTEGFFLHKGEYVIFNAG